MKKLTIAAAFLASLAFYNCTSSEANNSNEEVTEETATAGQTIKVTLAAKSDSKLTGDVLFTENGDKVTMEVNVAGIAPGEHAIHIHQVPDCSSSDGKSAGGHWNPAMKDHGKWGEMAHHAGDIGNLVADANGNASMTFSTEMWCIGCADSTKNIINRAIIIHADVDDFKTQPTGNAGGRIGCGVIE